MKIKPVGQILLLFDNTQQDALIQKTAKMFYGLLFYTDVDELLEN